MLGCMLNGVLVIEGVEIPAITPLPPAVLLERDKFVEVLKRIRKPDEWIFEKHRPLTREDVEEILSRGVVSVGFYEGDILVTLRDGTDIVLTPPKAKLILHPPPPTALH